MTLNTRPLFAVVLMTTSSDFSPRLTASPARENTFPLDLALPAESHCSSLTTLIRHGHSTSTFPPSCHLCGVTKAKGRALHHHQWKTNSILALLELEDPQEMFYFHSLAVYLSTPFLNVKIPVLVYTSRATLFCDVIPPNSVCFMLLTWNKVPTQTTVTIRLLLFLFS